MRTVDDALDRGEGRLEVCKHAHHKGEYAGDAARADEGGAVEPDDDGIDAVALLALDDHLCE